MGTRLSYECVKNYIEGEEGNGCKLLSTEYKNNRTKLKIQCACGEVFEVSFHTFKNQNQKQCPDCGYKKVSKKLSLDYSEVKAFIEDNGCKLLSTEYVDSKTELKIQCACGEVFEKTFSHFKIGKKMCEKCTIKQRVNSRKTPYEKIKNFVNGEQGSGCELLTTLEEYNMYYKNKDSKIKVRCVCGDEFTVRWGDFHTNEQKQCKKCGIARRCGENNPMNRPEVREMCSKRQKELWSNEEYRSQFCGENSVHWLKDKTPEEREKQRCYPEYTQFTNKVYERDNYTCQCCGQYGGSLNAHHLNGYHYDKEHRTDINNGICLCSKCHDEFHKIYSKRNNTIAQFREFLFNKYLQSNNLKFLSLIETIDLTTRAF